MSKPIKVFVLIKGLDVGGAEKLLTTTLPRANREDFQYEVGYLVPGGGERLFRARLPYDDPSPAVYPG